jgi:hypothetical protein
MTTREATDLIKTLLPFASAIVEIGEKLDSLAPLDLQLVETTNALNTAKKQHAETKAATEAAIKAATDAKITAKGYADQRTAEIDTHHRQSMLDIAKASDEATAKAKDLLDKANVDAAAKQAESERAATATIEKAQADVAALKAENAELAEKTVIARADYAATKQLLDDINARLDQHRKL